MARPESLPGYQPILKSPEHQLGPLDRTLKYIGFLRDRTISNKAERNEAILKSDEAPLDVEKLARAPLFNFEHGFMKYPPIKYHEGEEPPVAPLSEEQMRLLLMNTVPMPMMGFVLDRFIFSYEPTPPEDGTPPGPTVETVSAGGKQKVKITFYQENFQTRYQAKRERSGDKLKKQKKRYITSYVDPTKISMYVGKIIAKMIPRPENWDKIVDDKFSATKTYTNKKRPGIAQEIRSKIIKDPTRVDALRQKQWEDFVGMSLTAPELAMQRYPDAYRYLNQQTETFTDPQGDDPAIQRLEDNMGQYGPIKEFKIDDLRTEEEKIEDKGLTPQLYWYEKAIAGLNKIVPGWRLTYTLPENTALAAQLGGDDKEIKRLMESDETDRDLEFGELLASVPDFDKTARNEARRYLLASSQTGEFAEWRIYAWLFKFSKTFRDTRGKQISDDDYQNLQAIYNQAESVGKRVSASVLPYEAIQVRAPEHPEAKNYGRRVYLYVRKDRAKLLKEQEKKARLKNIDAILEGSEKAFKQFETPSGLIADPMATFNAQSPEGLEVASGSLTQLLGNQLGTELGGWLSSMGVTRVSPDALAYATAYYDYFKEYEHSTNVIGARLRKPAARKIMSKYGSFLNRPPEERVKEVLSVSASDVLTSGSVPMIFEQSQKASQAKEDLLKTIGINFQDSAGILPSTKDRALKLLENGVTTPQQILRHLQPAIANDFRGNTLEAQREERNLIRFLFNPNTEKNLALLKQVMDYESAIVPPQSKQLKDAAQEVQSQPKLLIGSDTKLNPDHIKILEAVRIIDPRRLQEIENTQNRPVEGAVVQEGAEPEMISLTAEEIESNKISYVQESIKAADPDHLELTVFEFASRGISSLDNYLAGQESKKVSFMERYTDWLSGAGRIFNAPSLVTVKTQLAGAIGLMDRPGSIRQGMEQKDMVIRALERATHYEKIRLENKLKPIRTTKEPGGGQPTGE